MGSVASWLPWCGPPATLPSPSACCSAGLPHSWGGGDHQESPSLGEQTDLCFLSPQYKAATLLSARTGQDLREEHPWVDYTSPSLITLLFTDLGVLTPSAVSDELIKLYL